MHQLLQYTSGLPFWRAPWLALPAGFAQRRKARRGQGDPPRTMRRLLDICQASGTTPVRNRAHIHMEQLGRGLRRIASIPALPSATGPGGLGTARENGIGRADPRDFCRREGPSQAWSGAFLVQESRSLAVRMMRGKAPDPGNNGGRGAAATKYNLFASLSNMPIGYMTVADGWAQGKWGSSGMLHTEAVVAVLAVLVFVAAAFALRSGKAVLQGP